MWGKYSPIQSTEATQSTEQALAAAAGRGECNPASSVLDVRSVWRAREKALDVHQRGAGSTQSLIHPPVPRASDVVDWSDISAVYQWYNRQRPAPWMPSVGEYLRLRGAKNPAQTKLKLYDSKTATDGKYPWGLAGKLRREVYFASLFHEQHFFKQKTVQTPEALAHSWAAFIDNWNKGPGQWLSRLDAVRANFLLSVKRGIVMLVHFACQDAQIACAVPKGLFCDMCGTMGRDSMLDEEEIPSRIWELIHSISNDTAGQADSNLRTITQDLRYGFPTPSGKLSKSALESHDSKRCDGRTTASTNIASADTDLDGSSEQPSSSHSVCSAHDFMEIMDKTHLAPSLAADQALFKLEILERLEAHESALMQLRDAHNELLLAHTHLRDSNSKLMLEMEVMKRGFAECAEQDHGDNSSL